MVIAKTDTGCVLAGSALLQRGKDARMVGREAADDLGACVCVCVFVLERSECVGGCICVFATLRYAPVCCGCGCVFVTLLGCVCVCVCSRVWAERRRTT